MVRLSSRKSYLSHRPYSSHNGSRIPVRYLAKTEHFNGGFTKFVMLSTGQIDTNRIGGTEALSSAVDVLSDDGWMGIFPEGTRSRHTSPPFLQKGKTGIARLAAKFPHASVVPICIKGAGISWRR